MERRARTKDAGVTVEREAFVVARDPSIRTIAELQKRYDTLAREYEQLQREREALACQVATSGTAPAAAANQIADAQKAILAIRQARDSVLAHNHDLCEKLSRAEEQLAELRADREVVERARDEAVRQAQEVTRECDELRRKTVDLTEQKLGDLEVENDRNAAVAAANEKLATLIDERTADRVRLAEQNAELERLRKESQNSGGSPDDGSKELIAELEEAKHKRADMEAQMAGFREQQKKNIASLTRHLNGERESVRAQLLAEKGELEAQITALKEQLAANESAAASGGHGAESAPLAELLEQQRLEISDLNDQLSAARGELSALRSSLDEARSGAATSATTAPAPGKEKSEAAKACAARPLSDLHGSAMLGAMSSCVEMLRQHPTSVEMLDELEGHFRTFAESARSAGHAAIDRFSATCSELTRYFRKTPGKLNETTLQPLDDALQFLARLTGLRGAALIPDPTDASVFAVDDDPDNCECISMALEKMRLRTRYALKPEAALADLAANRCDLIILDVDLPRMDGFELYSRIRKIEHHRTTPVVFLSALTSTRERLQAEVHGSGTFIAKPYNLNELGLRALALILDSRLAAAE